MFQLLWKRIWRLLKKWNVESPYKPVILILGIYWKQDSDTCILVFVSAIVHSSQKVRKSQIDEYANKMLYINDMEYYVAI